jgi:hypothetical protein
MMSFPQYGDNSNEPAGRGPGRPNPVMFLLGCLFAVILVVIFDYYLPPQFQPRWFYLKLPAFVLAAVCWVIRVILVIHFQEQNRGAHRRRLGHPRG